MKTLSRRERQILDILYGRGRATALLRILEKKGLVRHEADGPRYIFSLRIPRDRACRSALRHLLQTFFDDSAGQAVAALLDVSAAKLTPQELDRIEALIERARTRNPERKTGHDTADLTPLSGRLPSWPLPLAMNGLRFRSKCIARYCSGVTKALVVAI
jgi:BlaI family transcriptional regulator, penicillinase repressor